REGRLVEPDVHRRVVDLAGPEAVGTLAADAGVGAIARDRGGERPAAAPDVDALDLPAAADAVAPGGGRRGCAGWGARRSRRALSRGRCCRRPPARSACSGSSTTCTR